MKKIGKFLLTSILAVSTMLSMAACNTGSTSQSGGGDNSTSVGGNDNPVINKDEIVAPVKTADVTDYNGSPVTIQFYHCMGANLRGVVSKWIADFNTQYPNITIEGLSTSLGDYDGVKEQISTEITAGNSPHIAFCYPDHVAHYNLAGKVVALDNYIMDDTMGLTEAELYDFVPAFYNEGKVYGSDTMYTLPFAKSTEVMYYNKTYFEKNNLSVPKTWDEMEAVCQQILDIEKAKGNTNVIPLGYDSEANWFITMCEQLNQPYTSATGDHFVFDTPTNRDFVERFTSWHKKGYVTTQEINGSYTSDLFTDETAFMCIGSSAGASYQKADVVEGEGGGYKFEVGVTTPPQADASNAKVISQGPSLVLFKKSNEQEVAASWLLMKYLTTKVELQAEYSMTSGYMPVIKAAQNHEVYQEFLAKADGGAYLQAACVKQSIAQMDYYYVSPAFDGSSAAREAVATLIQACFVNAPADAAGIETYVANKFEETIEELEMDYS